MIGNVNKFSALVVGYHFPRYNLIAFLIRRKLHVFTCLVEISVKARLGQHNCDGFARVRIKALHGSIVNLRANTQCRVGG